MYDGGKVIVGLVIFIALATTPFWYGGLFGQATRAPELVTGTNEPACVEKTAWMRANHMEMLNYWRDRVVRDGIQDYESETTGKVWHHLELSETCLEQCHKQKDKFCDRCHSFVGVDPYCWECHTVPGQEVE